MVGNMKLKHPGIIAILLVSILLLWCIDLNPIQNPYDGKSVTLNSYGDVYVLTPVATYEISAKLMRKSPYHDKLGISPVDFVLVWGEMAKDDSNVLITYRQSLRWYSYQYKSNLPFIGLYIQSHSSNNHIIPANDSILQAINSIDEGNRVTIKGYLVNVIKNNGIWHWWTSKSRYDQGDGSCEIIYVTEVIKK